MTTEETQAYSTVASSRLGDLWICTTDRGICSVSIGGAPEEGLRRLERYGVRPEPADHPLLDEAVAQLKAYLALRLEVFGLPLDLRGTRFQRAVWTALLQIPYGETRTYGEIAAAVGNPRAARAAGQAVGANPIGIIVPCHRVIGKGGDLVGYGGGLDLKVALLQLEQSAYQMPIPEE